MLFEQVQGGIFLENYFRVRFTLSKRAVVVDFKQYTLFQNGGQYIEDLFAC